MELPTRYPLDTELRDEVQEPTSITKKHRCAVLNASSLRNKAALFRQYVQSKDLVFVTETWLKEDDPSSVFSNSGEFDIFRKDRGTKGGGVMAAVRKGIPVIHRQDLERDGLELLCLQLISRDFKLMIFVFYCPPGDEQAMRNFQSCLQNLPPDIRRSLLIVGDLNSPSIDWSISPPKSTRHHSPSSILLEIAAEHRLCQKVKEVTRIREGYTPSLLDLVLSNKPHLIRNVRTSENLTEKCDHVVISFELAIWTNKQPVFKRYLWKGFSEESCYHFRTDIAHQDWTFLRSKTSIDERWTMLERRLLCTARRYFGLRLVNSRNLNRIVLLPEAVSAIKRCRRMFMKAKKSGSLEDKRRLKEATKVKAKLIRHSQQRAINSIADDPAKSGKRFWTLVKQQADSTGIPPLLNGGSYHTSNRAKAELLNDHFTSVFSPTEAQPAGTKRPPLVFGHRISMASVIEAVGRIPNGSSSGGYLLTNDIVKAGGVTLAAILADFFESCVRQSKIPTSWKSADIVPIPKAGDRSDKSNWRPIALLHPVSKVFERIVYQKLYAHVKNLLSPRQYGFRSGRSTEIQMAILVEKIFQAFNSGIQIDAVALDMAKAFDRVPHDRLLEKMTAMDIPDYLVWTIRDYLTERSQRTVVDGVASKTTRVPSGVPQGSVLGPLLFLIFINDLPACVTSDLDLFADDSIVYRAVQSPEDQEALQQDIERLSSWSVLNRLPFNASKSVHITFTKRTKPLLSSYSISEKEIPKQKSIKHLGVILDAGLTFREQTENVAKKLRKRIGVLRFVLGRQNNRARLTAFKAIALPILNYCASVWFPWQKSYSDSISRTVEELKKDLGMERLNSKDFFRKVKLFPPQVQAKRLRLLLLYKVATLKYPGREVLLEASHVSSRETRQRKKITEHPMPLKTKYAAKIMKDCYKQGWLSDSIMMWNDMLMSRLNVESIGRFKGFLLRFFVNNVLV